MSFDLDRDSGVRRPRRPRTPGPAAQEEKDGDSPAGVLLELQRRVGNAAVSRFLQRQDLPRGGATGAPAPAPATPGTGPSATPAPTPAAGDDTTVHWWFVDATTHTQLAALLRLLAGETEIDAREVPSGDSSLERAALWIDEARSTADWIESRGSEPLSPEMAARGRTLLGERDEIYHAFREAKDAVVRAEIRRAAANADAAAARAEALKPKLDDALRAAYRSDDESLIEKAAGAVGSVLDIGLGLHELSRHMMEDLFEQAGLELPPVSRLTEGLDKINTALTLFDLATSLTGERAATDVEEGMRQLGIGVDIISALPELPPPMGLYLTLYVTPMLEAISHQLSILVDQLHELNRDWVELFGEPGYPEAEPGGMPMWRFMAAVMHAESADEVPVIPDSVKEYLVDRRESLEAGAGEEVPTEGWWFWRSLDTPRAREWIFDHRDRVWAMLYGSMSVPAPRG